MGRPPSPAPHPARPHAPDRRARRDALRRRARALGLGRARASARLIDRRVHGTEVVRERRARCRRLGHCGVTDVSTGCWRSRSPRSATPTRGCRSSIPAIRAMVPDVRMAGPAFTVLAPDDHLPVFSALAEAAPGDVLVIVTGEGSVAVLGELFATEAQRRGLAGVVIDGLCRDVAGLRRNGLPVFARGTIPRSGGTVARPALNEPVAAAASTSPPATSSSATTTASRSRRPSASRPRSRRPSTSAAPRVRCSRRCGMRTLHYTTSRTGPSTSRRWTAERRAA